MSELLTNQISRLRNIYRKSIASILVTTLVIFVLKYITPGSIELSQRYALMGKSIIILLFLLTVPFVVSHLRQRIKRIPSSAPLSERLSSYMGYFRIKAVIFLVLSALILLGFFFSGDPMILILLVAVLVFFYFERPNRLKIQEDLRVDENSD
ncbi:MAG: hypothetical protein ACQER7_04295 [Bacteroidota bacterium]